MAKLKLVPLEKIYWPCDLCIYEGKCDYHRGCYRWKVWFRSYWHELRRRVLGIEVDDDG